MGSNSYALIETSDHAEWDALVEASPQGKVFSKSGFLSSLGAPFRLFKLMAGPKPVALLSLIEDASGQKVLRYDFTPHQGILFLDDPRLAARQRVLDEFRITEFIVNELTSRYAEIGMLLSWKITDLRPFLWHNYHEPQLGQFAVTPRYTALLDLTAMDADAYPAETRACRRQELKKAAPYEVEESKDVALFLKLYTETFARQEIGLDQRSIDLVRSIAVHAVEHGYGRLSACSTPDGVASMNLFLYDSKRAYYMFAANNPDLRNTGAATRLMFDNIFEAKRRGMQEVDFVGVNSPNRGDFKLSFNPELKLYFDVRFARPTA